MLFLDSFNIELNRNRILKRMQCDENSEIYDVLIREYQSISILLKQLIHAKAVLAIDQIPISYGTTLANKKKGLYVLLTLGDEVSKYIDGLFAEDKYLKALLCSTIADDYLFQVDKEIEAYICSFCREHHVHTVKRLEAPSDISMQVQKVAFDLCNGESLLNLHLNDYYMFDPIKTLCILYELEDGDGEFTLGHDCSTCHNLTCPDRRRKENLGYSKNIKREKII